MGKSGGDMMGRQSTPSWPADTARRQFLRRAIALGAVGPGLLAACADAAKEATGGTQAGPAGSTTAPTTQAPTTAPTTLAPTTTIDQGVVFDPSSGYWQQGGFRPVTAEVEAFDLAVTGALPPALDGLYVRNGSNGFGPSAHWFFGEGMVHGVELSGGRALSYRNRWVRTPVYDAATGGEPVSGPPGGTASQSNVSVYSHAGRLLSLGEIGWPYELDPTDLSTLGPLDYGGALGANFTAHPKIDPDTGLMHAFGYGLLEAPFLTYFVIAADGQSIVHSTPIELGASTMIHDFAITESDVVFWEGPVLFDLDMAIRGEPIPYRWDESYGARIGLMPLGGTGDQIRWIEVDPMFVFHGTNAHRDGDLVVVDVSKLPDFFREYDGLDGPSVLTRWIIDTSGDQLTLDERPLTDLPLDLPGLDRRRLGRRIDRAWYVTTQQTADGNVWFEGLTGYEFATGREDRWISGPDLQPNEPFFVPDPTGGPDEGWLLSYVWDRRTDESVLAVLDSTDLAAGPVATVALPQRVPFGFHAAFHQA